MGGRLRVGRQIAGAEAGVRPASLQSFRTAPLIAIDCNARAKKVPSRSAERARQGRIDICRSEEARDRLQCGRHQRRRRVHRSAWHRGHSGAVHPPSWRRQEILPDRLAEGPAYRRFVLAVHAAPRGPDPRGPSWVSFHSTQATLAQPRLRLLSRELLSAPPPYGWRCNGAPGSAVTRRTA